MYHRVLDRDAKVNPSLVSTEPAAFDRQMKHLARHYRVVSTHEVLAAVRSGRPLPQRAVLITFDDAYRDFADIAWPILRKHRLPATVFVPTDYPDHPERSLWWDRLYHAVLHTRARSVTAGPLGRLRLDSVDARLRSLRLVQRALKRVRHADCMRRVNDLCRDLACDGEGVSSVLTWHEVRALAEDGVAIGGHTRSHAALDQLPLESVREEVQGCRDDLIRELGTVPSVFAYPFGSYDDAVVEAVSAAGFELAFTCEDGHSRLGSTDPLRLHRTGITPRTSTLLFRFRLLTVGTYIDRWRHAGALRGRDHATPA